MRVAFSVVSTSVVDVDEVIWEALKESNPELDDGQLFKLYVEKIEEDNDEASYFWGEVHEELEVSDIDYSDVSVL